MKQKCTEVDFCFFIDISFSEFLRTSIKFGVNYKTNLSRRSSSSSSSFEEVSTPGQTQTGLGPTVYPFTTPDCCTA